MNLKSQLEEAAEDFVKYKICYEGLEYALSGNTAKECTISFIAGAKWAIQSELVGRLASRLEEIQRLCSEIRRPNEFTMDGVIEIASEALAAFEAAKKELE